MNQLFPNAYLVRISCSDIFTRFRIIGQEKCSGRSFLCDHDKLLSWLQSDDYTYLETDCGNLLQATRRGSMIILKFCWMNLWGGKISGEYRTVQIPLARLIRMLETDDGGVFLSYERQYDAPSRFDFTHASRTLQRILASPDKKRALSKALCRRQAGRYGETMTFYNDLGDSLYFVSESTHGSYNGGLVLHHAQTSEGIPYIHYSIHT